MYLCTRYTSPEVRPSGFSKHMKTKLTISLSISRGLRKGSVALADLTRSFRAPFRGEEPSRYALNLLLNAPRHSLPTSNTHPILSLPNQPVCSGATRGRKQRRSSSTTGDSRRKHRCSTRFSDECPDDSGILNCHGYNCAVRSLSLHEIKCPAAPSVVMTMRVS